MVAIEAQRNKITVTNSTGEATFLIIENAQMVSQLSKTAPFTSYTSVMQGLFQASLAPLNSSR